MKLNSRTTVSYRRGFLSGAGLPVFYSPQYVTAEDAHAVQPEGHDLVFQVVTSVTEIPKPARG